MKTFISRIFVIIMFVVGVAVNVHAQVYSVTFAYDANGNRISRVITFTDEYRNNMSDTTNVESLTDCIDECDINIYPNPTTENISIKIGSYEEDRNIVASLYSPLGVCMDRREISTDMTSFNLYDLPSGTYILELSDGKEKKTWKIIKR
ncbi:MAG: T9SS type A sorting domain-containing protein [Bacteroidales bacterium]|nr:T9SS type A sorting domain-containing protein [Bacteroidales bacterium]